MGHRQPFRFPDDIEGYSSEAECLALYDLACRIPEDGVIVELGTYKGRSAVAMAQSGRTVWAFDRFQPESYFFNPLPDHRSGNFGADIVRQNAGRYRVRVHILEADTVEAGRYWQATNKPPFDLLFIDAGHEYEHVRADTMTWLPMVKDVGVVVFDDSIWPGVMRLICELDDWTPVPRPQAGGLTAMRRVAVAERIA